MNFEIISFIIYDPSLNVKEDEDHKKIFYCHPKTVNESQQMKTIGLCQAMCNFAKEFTDSACQYIHTLKTRIIMQNFENEISIVMTVGVPRKSSNPDEYMDDDLQNSIYEVILKHCQQMFFLFMGPPSFIIAHDGLAVFIEKLARFFDRYISQGMLDGYQITDGIPGVQLLFVDKNMYDEAKQLVTRFEAHFTDTIGSMMLFNNNLVYYTVEKNELGILYRYLTTTLLAKYHVNEAMTSTFISANMGKFIIGPFDSNMKYCSSSGHRIFFRIHDYLDKSVSAPREVYVLVYKAMQACLVFFVDVDNSMEANFFDKIHTYLGPELTKLNNSFSQKCEKFITDTPFRYVYWNPDTLSMKCTLFPTRQWKSEFRPLIPLDSMRVMTDVKQEYNRHDKINSNVIKEMAVKLQSDSWIIGIENHGKQLFVCINKRNYSLVDVSKEMKHLCNRDFPNVFKLEPE